MLIVGLTGGISTGKSSVSKHLAELAFPIVDADLIARQVVEPGTSCLKRVAKTFGPEVIQADGTLDRKALNTIVFADERNRRKLNAILHPAIRRRIAWQVVRCWLRGERVCILDVPLLIETGMWRWCSKVVVVYCTSSQQLRRLMARDGYSEQDAQTRIQTQMNIDKKAEYADYVLDNTSSKEDAKVRVVRLARQLDADAGWTWKLNWLLPPAGLISGAVCLLRRYLTIKTPS